MTPYVLTVKALNNEAPLGQQSGLRRRSATLGHVLFASSGRHEPPSPYPFQIPVAGVIKAMTAENLDYRSPVDANHDLHERGVLNRSFGAIVGELRIIPGGFPRLGRLSLRRCNGDAL
jgi:hypothetical protein